VPHYVIQFGGRVREGETRFARGEEAIPARNVRRCLAGFLRELQESPQHPDLDGFLEAGGREVAAQLAGIHRHVPAFEDDKNYYFDWGAEEVFSLAGRGPGECSAGVFDLIEVDLSTSRDSLREGDLLRATLAAARALLVTRGHEARNDRQTLEFFRTDFLDEGAVDARFRPLVEDAARCMEADSGESFSGSEAEVAGLIDSIEEIYENMSSSLRHRRDEKKESTETGEERADREADLRGVACPLNYVKTKLALGEMESGQVLSVLLDGEGAKNVPESAKQDGHQVVDIREDGESSRVLIRKA